MVPQSPTLNHQQTTKCSKYLACLSAGAIPAGMVLPSTQLGEGGGQMTSGLQPLP